jgi:hypothetical protein
MRTPTTTIPLPMTERQSQHIALLVTNCKTGHSYVAKFDGPKSVEFATAFIDARSSTHAFHIATGADEREWADEFTPWSNAEATLYSTIIDPPCEHGLSSWLCAGPGHYPMDM